MTAYVRADLKGLPHLLAGAARSLQRPRARAIRQRLDGTPQRVAERIELALSGGADEVLLGTTADLETTLRAVDLATHRIAFDRRGAAPSPLAELRQLAAQRGVSPTDLKLELGFDPIRELIRGHARGPTRDGRIGEIVTTVAAAADLPGCVPLAVHGCEFHAVGADAATELACSIATGIEYVRRLRDAAPSAASSAPGKLCFRYSVGTAIYAEIAKLRAARLLWAKVARAFGSRTGETTIHAVSSGQSHASDDVHTNLIRTGIQAFTATLANCDSITIEPFAATADASDADFADLLARNQQLLLREESLLHRTNDPGAGAYAVESMTHRVAAEAWEFIREIERSGGMLRALEAGIVQRRVQESATTRRLAVQTRTQTLVGINRFVDPEVSQSAALASSFGGDEPEDRPGNDLSLAAGFLEPTPDGTAFEQLRTLVRSGRHRVQPVLTSTTATARARYEFVRDYFTVGGFEVLAPIALTAVAAPPPPPADYLVLCGDDPDYPQALTELPATARVVIAGPPQEVSPTTTFVHRGDNTYLTLRGLYLRLHDATEGDLADLADLADLPDDEELTP